jgi:O-antigen ligase
VTHFHVLSAVFLLLPSVFAFAPVQTSGFLAIATSLTFGAWLWAERRLPAINRTLALAVSLFILYGTLSAFWSIDPIASLQLAFRITMLSAAGLVLCGIVGALTSEQRQFIGYAALSGAALAMSLLYVDVLGDGVIQIKLLREEHADYGRTVSLFVLMVWGLLTQSPVHSRPILATGMITAVAGILLLAPGFAAKVAMLVGLATLFAAWRFRAGFSKIVFALITLAFLLGPTLAHKFDQPDYYRPLIAADSELAPMRWTVAIAHRLHILGYTATRTLEHPILGWGLDASRRLPDGADPIEPVDLGFTRDELHTNAAAWLDRGTAVHLPLHPHNTPLQIWLELGLLGALIACGFVIYLVNAAVHHRHPAGLALCLSALVIANFSYGTWQSWWLSGLWLVSALYLVGVPPNESKAMQDVRRETTV